MTLLLTSRRWRRFVAFIVALPVLYVVSFGPVCRLAPQSTKSDAFIHFYKPLLRLANSFDGRWANDAIHWYGGDRAMFMPLIVLVTDTINMDRDGVHEEAGDD
jgi:hypothetical protein